MGRPDAGAGVKTVKRKGNPWSNLKFLLINVAVCVASSGANVWLGCLCFPGANHITPSTLPPILEQNCRTLLLLLIVAL